MKLVGILLACIIAIVPVASQALTYAEKIAQLTQEKDNAEARVKAIVNQPVQSVPYNSYALVEVVSPGWFHAGAAAPDYSADVSKTQEFPYKKTYVTSDVTPGLMYKADELEFNKQLKFYYTDMKIPKKRLSATEMVEINGLYRIIGANKTQIASMQEFIPSTQASISEFFNSLAGTILELVIVSLVAYIIYKKKFS